MRAVLVVLIILASGFDHAKHATSTQDALACSHCHPTTKNVLAKPGHAACFGKCHGPAPAMPARGKKLAVDPQRAHVCTTCHTQTALAGTDKKAFTVMPPSPAEFVLATGHKRHAAVACAQCHPQRPPAPHVRCASCHDGGPGKGPPMALCTGCHLRADPTQPQPEARLLVRSAFSHGKHAARTPAGAKCATCHVVDTDARELPHPTAKLCSVAGCHDAKAAFPTTAACTRCHQDVPAIKFVVPRPDKAFSHTKHLPYVAFVACSTCHPIAKSGEVGLANHAQCASCHDDDFGSRDPFTCGACHDATEPWRKLLPDRPSLPKSEFGASLDHGKHAAACASCHSLTTPAAQLRPARGHAACVGQGCHANAGGAPPAFTFCAGCHDLGLADRREAERMTAPWSVRKQFVHAKHERGLDGTALACAACHVDMTGRDVLALATPPKSTCAPCHDGQASFKLTGTACTRCHPSQ